MSQGVGGVKRVAVLAVAAHALLQFTRCFAAVGWEKCHDWDSALSRTQSTCDPSTWQLHVQC